MAPIKKGKQTSSRKSAGSIPEDKKEPVESVSVVSGQLKKKLKKNQRRATRTSGLIMIKHLPHGFFEEQLQNYFDQFGTVTRLRLARSKRTGGSKGYAFVEFEYPEVAQVAAETMNNYLIFKKVVKASYIPPEKQVHNYFRSSVRKVQNKAGKVIYVSSKTASIQKKVKEHNSWTSEAYQKRTLSQLNKIKKLNTKYAHLGLDFNKIILGSNIVSKKEYEEQNEDAVASKVITKNKSSTQKKNKKELQLEDLLGSTLVDDSDDEDYIGNENKQAVPVASKHIIKKNIPAQKKNKKELELEDILGSTLVDDSEDEDYIGNENKHEVPFISKHIFTKNIPAEKKNKKELELEDLLGSTLVDDSEDEDYMGLSDNECDSNTSTEETYGVTNGSGEENIEKDTKVKPSKGTKIIKDPIDNLINRKPNAGGIQKPKKNKKKVQNQTQPAKNLVKIKAAKKIAQPLSLIQNKINSKTKKVTGKKQKV